MLLKFIELFNGLCLLLSFVLIFVRWIAALWLTEKTQTFYRVRREGEMHENRRFLSTGMEIANNAYAYVLKALSRS